MDISAADEAQRAMRLSEQLYAKAFATRPGCRDSLIISRLDGRLL